MSCIVDVSSCFVVGTLPLMFESMFVLMNTSEFLEEKCIDGF